MTDLTGRVAFVTGAAQGIGRATAERLAADGASVIVADLNADGARDVARAIEKDGGRALGVGCDVSDKDSVESAVANGAEELGPVGILVNNAGVIRDNLLFRTSDEDWTTVIGTHLNGAFFCARAAQKYMVEQRWGRIVSISSVAALGHRGQVNYSAAKAGIQGFTKTLALELGQFGITANSLAPGFVETDMVRQTAERRGVDFDAFKADVAKRNPMRRTAVPGDIAGVISLLCSEDASFVNGQIIYVAGGPRN
ncbi:SDR family oxidoreductase [Amycolatopsis acidicola]|uniref:SDR family oxidoreductase n=1 Tax=Amycolatopsis acidicola TaxID=2596893 RepID=A0A5N0VE85_9PSEU|nr:3-oxoacyl-ACP reductase FabG [Amycolatopsis acidicola]KAA9164375.1 SDR family oxidoreductase [Amycolatopsis acidicola]